MDLNENFSNLEQELKKNEKELQEKIVAGCRECFEEEIISPFREEMESFQNEMRGFQNERKGFQNEMQGFQDEVKRFRNETNAQAEKVSAWKSQLETLIGQVGKNSEQYAAEMTRSSGLLRENLEKVGTLADQYTKSFQEIRLSQKELEEKVNGLVKQQDAFVNMLQEGEKKQKIAEVLELVLFAVVILLQLFL